MDYVAHRLRDYPPGCGKIIDLDEIGPHWFPVELDAWLKIAGLFRSALPNLRWHLNKRSTCHLSLHNCSQKIRLLSKQ